MAELLKDKNQQFWIILSPCDNKRDVKVENVTNLIKRISISGSMKVENIDAEKIYTQ